MPLDWSGIPPCRNDTTVVDASTVVIDIPAELLAILNLVMGLQLAVSTMIGALITVPVVLLPVDNLKVAYQVDPTIITRLVSLYPAINTVVPMVGISHLLVVGVVMPEKFKFPPDGPVGPPDRTWVKVPLSYPDHMDILP